MVLSVRLCSFQEHWLHVHCGQTLNLCYVDPSAFLLKDNSRLRWQEWRAQSARGQGLEGVWCASDSCLCPTVSVSVQACSCVWPGTHSIIADTWAFAGEWGDDCVYKEANTHCFGYDFLISYTGRTLLPENLRFFSPDRIKHKGDQMIDSLTVTSIWDSWWWIFSPFLNVSHSCLGSAFSFHSNWEESLMTFHKVHMVLIIHCPHIGYVHFNVMILISGWVNSCSVEVSQNFSGLVEWKKKNYLQIKQIKLWESQETQQ